jgi:enamine deaminase RidA (YjgF/YER057c/UK114 family)
MATTDTRSGFRLPWSTDRSASREATADPAESTPAEAGLDPEPGVASDVVDDHETTQDATGDAVRSEQEEPVTILAPETATTHAHVGSAPAPEATDETPAETSVPEAVAPAQLVAAEPARRPTKFLADLTRAMQAAAEQARTATIEQYQADGTAVIEEIHATSANTVGELRRRADDDVAGIKDWSKAEIARIREETEQGIAARREQLEGQLERHAALVEHEIERVRGQLAAFQEAMGRFFDDLAGEEDPARFAARAANLPEPPQFDPTDADAVAALLAEPGIGAPALAAPVAPEPEAVVEAPEAPTAAEELAAESEAVVADAPAAEAEPYDREAALAAIQAAAEAAAASDAAEAEVVESPAEAQAEETAGEPAQVEAVAEAEVEVDAVAEAEVEAASVGDGEAVPADQDSDPFSTELDPRLAMLGLEPDFAAAAEVAAAEAAAADADAVPEIGGDALAARLSGLVPDATSAEPAQLVTTQVVTSGLVSVASIASFKRHLGRLDGVGHVGVSSGPDGEFVFAVQHEPSTSLRDLVPTIPGFGARVTDAGDGVVHVSAQDPQD